MRKILMTTLAALVLALAAVGCGSSSPSGPGTKQPAVANSQASQGQQGQPVGPEAGGSNHTHFAKTKFAIHAGLAFAAFHRYIYKPYKAGEFSGGFLHHKAAYLKGGLAAAFAYHEVRLALNDARSSRVLSKVLSPLLALQTKLSQLRSLRFGHANPAAIQGANTSVGAVSNGSAAAGQPIQDQPTPQLGG